MEHIEIAATPALADEILTVALSRASRVDPPPGGDELVEFLRGPLYQRMHERLGAETAAHVLADLVSFARMQELNETSERKVDRATVRARNVVPVESAALRAELEGSAPKAPPLPHAPRVRADTLEPEPHPSSASMERPTGLPSEGEGIFLRETRMPDRGSPRVVLFATRDPSRSEALARALGVDSCIEVVDDAMDLIDAIETATDCVPVVVLDAAAESVRPATFASMLPDLGKRVHAVLWGYDGETERVLVAFTADAARWTWLTSDACAEDVALLMRAL